MATTEKQDRPLRVLHINNTDLAGRRFNGFDLMGAMDPLGVESQMAVWDKDSKSEPGVAFLGKGRLPRFLNRIALALEARLGLQSILTVIFPVRLLVSKKFWRSDVIHLHLVHNFFFSLLFLPLISRLKKTVWTLHDPWALTGHCVHPYDCERWKIGCGRCPNLSTHLPMRWDNTAFMWRVKKWLYSLSPVELIVASPWMLSLVEKSPLLGKKKIHLVPFGLDLDAFGKLSKMEAKKKLGIDSDSITLGFRATTSEYKGFEFVKEALDNLRGQYKISLVSFAERGLLDDFLEHFHVVELGWTTSENRVALGMAATDIFLMPSKVEAFGVMAIEAMASGCAVIVSDGNALPDTVRSQEGGGVVSRSRDAKSLEQAIRSLLDDPDMRQAYKERARKLAVQYYSELSYLKKLLSVYRDH